MARSTPNDPLFGGLWGFSRIGAPLAWGASTGQADVVVADIDTGVDYTHPDLAANMWRNPGEVAGNGLDDDGNGYVDDIYGIDAAGRSSDPADDHGHGTHTSGTMAAVGDNGIGVTGVNWTARIMALKFMDSSGSGYTSDAIACINYMTAEKLHYGVNVVAANCSWGGGDYSSLLHNAIAAAGDAGIVFACAAGNDGLNNDILPSYPASFDCSNIISVAATDADDALASFSNFGATSVDLAAPGTNILSTVPAFVDAGGYESWNGTSMATPHVTGAVALMAAAYPAESMATRIGMLESGVDPVAGLVGKVATGGRLDLADALYRETPLTITGFTPASGSEGTSVTVTGTGFTGATAVRFNGSAAATFTVDSATQITATVPAGATSGPISVTAPAGAAASPTSFTVAAAPPGDVTAPSVDASGATQGAWYRSAKTLTLTATRRARRLRRRLDHLRAGRHRDHGTRRHRPCERAGIAERPAYPDLPRDRRRHERLRRADAHVRDRHPRSDHRRQGSERAQGPLRQAEVRAARQPQPQGDRRQDRRQERPAQGREAPQPGHQEHRRLAQRQVEAQGQGHLPLLRLRQGPRREGAEQGRQRQDQGAVAVGKAR